MTAHAATLYLDRIAAVIFDLDGVVTDTAAVHARAWKRAFDEFLERHQKKTGSVQAPFDIGDDYLRFVDGKPRLDGARTFLASRGIMLPDEAGTAGWCYETVRSITERKTDYFVEEIQREGVAAYPATVELIRDLRRRQIRTAIVSSSRQCLRVLAAAHVDDLFDTRVDGTDADKLHLAGKPAPAMFLEAAQRLGVRPHRCAVVEDALAGVEAGRNGGFGVVIGIDRVGDRDGELYSHGADVVVRDLTDVSLMGGMREPVAAQL